MREAKQMANIAVLGTGAWGTALANVLLENHHHVAMWGVDRHEIADLKQGVNKKYYGDQPLVRTPDLVTDNLTEAVAHAQIVVLAIPSAFLVTTLRKLKKALGTRKVIFVNVAKGIDPKTGRTWSKVVRANCKPNCAGFVSLLGPSFAIEVFAKEKTAINAVSIDEAARNEVVAIFSSSYLHLVPITDEVGADLFAALKNVAAIGTGIVYGLSHSINTRSAILALVFKEIFLVYHALYKRRAKPEIGYELAGIGDLVLTCTSEKSRNFTFGLEVARLGVAQAKANDHKTVEGAVAAKILAPVLDKHAVHAPILRAICAVLDLQQAPETLIDAIMVKPTV